MNPEEGKTGTSTGKKSNKKVVEEPKRYFSVIECPMLDKSHVLEQQGGNESGKSKKKIKTKS